MSATRKLYEKVAANLRKERPSTGATEGEAVVWINAVTAVSHAFAADNANFNIVKFEEACGIPA